MEGGGYKYGGNEVIPCPPPVVDGKANKASVPPPGAKGDWWIPLLLRFPSEEVEILWEEFHSWDDWAEFGGAVGEW